MNRELASKEIMMIFLRIVSKYNSLEKIPVKHDALHAIFHSERHMLDRIGDTTDLNITELARSVGVTKGAISQVIKKLENKGLVRKFKKGSSDKEVFVELTDDGKRIHDERTKLNAETLIPLDEELSRYSDNEIALLISFFKWLDNFMDNSRKQMKSHH
jgi:DNA-binding MarR family transcriptional regulator